MLTALLLGAVFGIIILTGVAIAYNQFHVETTPNTNIFEILTDKQYQQLEKGHKISELELKQEQIDAIVQTIQHIEDYELELSEPEKILLNHIFESKIKEISQEDVNNIKKELADGLIKMGLNLKPEMLNTLDNKD